MAKGAPKGNTFAVKYEGQRRVRKQWSAYPVDLERLERLQELMGLDNGSEVIRHALAELEKQLSEA